MIDTINTLKKLGHVDQRFEELSRSSSPRGDMEAALQFVVGNSQIDVRLYNRVSISALRLELTFDKKLNYRAPELTERVQGLNNYINFQDNIITFVVLDIDEKGIEPGQGSVMKIPFDNEQAFEVTAAFASTRATGISEIGYTISKDPMSEESILLEQNDPNPFSGKTRLEFRIPAEVATKLVIYDVGGALVRTLLDSTLESGSHSVEWDGCDDTGKPVESGIYLYKLYAGVYCVTKKMVFLK